MEPVVGLLLLMLMFAFVRFIAAGVLLALGITWLVGLVIPTPDWLRILLVSAGFLLGITWHWNSLASKAAEKYSSEPLTIRSAVLGAVLCLAVAAASLFTASQASGSLRYLAIAFLLGAIIFAVVLLWAAKKLESAGRPRDAL